MSLEKGKKPVAGSGQQLALGLRSAPEQIAPTVIIRPNQATPSRVYDTYWEFAAERQEIFFRRFDGDPPPWTQDAILRAFKFTNAYRASDRVSQYLIRHVIYRSDLPTNVEEVFFRIIFFKLFNKIETWELVQNSIGPVTYETYSFARYSEALANALRLGNRIYSGAYIMPPGTRAFGYPAKHENHLRLLEMMVKSSTAQRIEDANNLRDVFNILRAFPSLGDFLAYQFTIDLNYSPILNFGESDFVVPGPGARDGLRKCFVDPGYRSEEDLIRAAAEDQLHEFERRRLDWRSLWGRPLQLIDCQNLFCEIDKYSRVRHPEVPGRTGRTRIKQRFKIAGSRINYFYPPKWGINEAVSARHELRDGQRDAVASRF